MTVLLLFLVLLAASWALTCLLVFLICALFGITFSLAIATGIWLLIFLLRAVFK